MADLSGITAVRPTANTQTKIVQYNATVAVGQSLVKSGTKYVLADANASAALAASEGIAMTPGVADGYGIMATGGNVILVGTTMTVGENYLVSRTSGGVMPNADKTSGDYITRLGTAATATQLNLAVQATGIQVP
jgi:glutamate synthase domain-containing protein 3